MNENQTVQTNTKEMKHIDYLIISPSIDLSEITKNCYKDMPFSLRMLFKGIGIKKDKNSDLLSFLLFESSFSKSLMDFGFFDAMNRKDEIRDFLKI